LQIIFGFAISLSINNNAEVLKRFDDAILIVDKQKIEEILDEVGVRVDNERELREAGLGLRRELFAEIEIDLSGSDQLLQQFNFILVEI
jgi:hypothetical protein